MNKQEFLKLLDKAKVDKNGNLYFIGDKEIIFDEVETTYVATIKECGPWRTDPIGNGFIRDVVTYEYITPENVEEGHRITEYKVGENAIKKYTYSEKKYD